MLKWLNRLFWLGLFFTAVGIAAISAFYFTLESSLPDVTSLREASLETPLRIYSADDALIAEYGEMRRIPLKIADIPQPMLDAFLRSDWDPARRCRMANNWPDASGGQYHHSAGRSQFLFEPRKNPDEKGERGLSRLAYRKRVEQR